MLAVCEGDRHSSVEARQQDEKGSTAEGAEAMRIIYECETDDCPERGKFKEVPPGETSQCKKCGWFMTAIH